AAQALTGHYKHKPANESWPTYMMDLVHKGELSPRVMLKYYRDPKGTIAQLEKDAEPGVETNVQGGGASTAGYRNPLRNIKGLTPERIDMGVDYAGAGPIFAIGPGVIVNTTNSGWPGGAFISERLEGGQYSGKYWYAAENIQPRVHVGQHVDSNTVIGILINASPHMETGWAAPPGTGET